MIEFVITDAESGHTLAKVVRSRLHEQKLSWNRVKRIIESRHVEIDGAICIDPARRLQIGTRIAVRDQPHRLPRTACSSKLVVRHLDEHVIVVEKPPGICSVRHPSELLWSEAKRRLDPTVHDLARWAIASTRAIPTRRVPPLRIVHRLDKETSGLLVFARSTLAERELGRQFRKHTVLRRYLAIVAGHISGQTIRSNLVRDRGDGRRGSTQIPGLGKPAVTHLEVLHLLKTATVVSCRLETGRTHQIRIHLAEAGHPVCGETVYTRRPDGHPLPTCHSAPRLCLHATELGFHHPVSGLWMQWTMPLPEDLARMIQSLS